MSMATTGDDAEAVEVRQEVEARQEDGLVTAGGPAACVGVDAAFERSPCRWQDDDIARDVGRIRGVGRHVARRPARGIGRTCEQSGGPPDPVCGPIVDDLRPQVVVSDELRQPPHAYDRGRPALISVKACPFDDASTLVPGETSAEEGGAAGGLCRLWRAVDHSAAVVIITDAAGRIEYVNPCFTKVTGYRLDEIAGKTPGILKSGRTPASDYRELWSKIRRGENWQGEFCNRRKDGSLYWGGATISPVKGRDGEITNFIAVHVDVSAIKQAEEELRVSEQRFRSLVETSLPGICIERNGKPLFVNRSFADIFGYDEPADIIQLGSLEPLYMQGDLARLVRCRQLPEKNRHTSVQSEVRGVRRDGSIVWLATQTKIISWSGGAALQTTVFDITLRKSYEERLVMQANHDPLTTLPNRTLALDRLTSATLNARRRGTRVAALFIDVDRFKRINDTLGHATGDRLLRQVAQRIRSAVREEDSVARLGGDEFIVVLPEVRQRADAEAVAEKIVQAAARSFLLDGHETFVTVSIGVSVFPDDGEDAEELMRHADAAMYLAKEDGRGVVRVFTPELRECNHNRMRLEADLRHALERNQLTLCYQPIVDVRSGRILGAEALLRWFNPELGQISPRQFVRLAEDTGLIVPIGEWVLTSGCAEARRWFDAGFGELYLSVNVSSRQFRGDSLIAAVRDALTTNRLRPERLELELTESLLLQDLPEASSTISRLEACGVRFAVDDFGTGCSSLVSLNRVPLHTLKMDHSFTGALLADARQSSMLDALILMAHRLELRVIAEGVERREQFEALRGRGCDIAQGYFFSPPLPPDDFLALLKNWPSRTARTG
jgi:diguanylate cyclase (GGDEF)-like protein/PAS domain S-box-containing protein